MNSILHRDSFRRLFRLTGLLALVIIALEIVVSYQISQTWLAGPNSWTALAKHIWLPHLGYLIIWLIILIGVIKNKHRILFMFPLAAIVELRTSINFLFKQQTNSWLSSPHHLLAGITAINIFLGLFAFAVWLTQTHRNRSNVKND